jgi:CheY-like chemotaxis protein
MTEETPILLVEDNEDDAVLTKRALSLAGVTNPIVVVETGPAAIDYLAGTNQFHDRARHPLPAVVLLDLKLPMMSGHEVLSWIRSQRHLEGLVVVVLTSSSEPSDLRRSYSLGANSYLVKPLTTGQLIDLGKAFQWPWLKTATTSSARTVTTATARTAVA